MRLATWNNGQGMPVGEELAMASPKTREAPTSPSAAGRGVVT